MNIFSQRAVKACAEALSKGRITPRHIKDILRCEHADVTPIERFLTDDNPDIRKAASRIVGEKGDVKKILVAAQSEKNKSVLFTMLDNVVRDKEGVEDLVGLLESEDQVIKNSAIAMFRRAGRNDCLFSLLFDDDPRVVGRIRGYIEEEDET